MDIEFKNPFRPGAGHMPPYLAGREFETKEFMKMIKQETILQNMILTGLRGVGKTVLLESFKPIALAEGWIWVGADISESSSVSEKTLATRLLTDLAIVTSNIVITIPSKTAGFIESENGKNRLDFEALMKIWAETPGLSSDKFKNILEYVWEHVAPYEKKGIIFAYDEAQNLTDHPREQEYPLSLLLDVFQSIQRKGIPFLLVLTGLPTLFPKLVEARTFAERMFHVVSLDKLDKEASSEAIKIPTQNSPVKFSAGSIDIVYKMTQGYPYFIQYVCKEVYDIWVSNILKEEELEKIPANEIIQKLDADFFAGRWSRATDRQRDLLAVIAQLESSNDEFTVQEIVVFSKKYSAHPFSNSHVNQMLSSLCNVALVHKNRWGKYILAVPLLDQFIRRQLEQR